MSTETATPGAEVQAETIAPPQDASLEAKTPESEDPESKSGEGEQGEPKKEKTPEERERLRSQRKIERLLAQRAELRAQLAQRTPQTESTRPEPANTTSHQQDANETLSLSRAELQQLIADEAKKLAPTLRQQEAEIEHRRAIVTSLAKEWGSEKFDAYAADLDEAFGGLADAQGRPKPATDAIFESDMPAALIEYLADPENADEAEALGRMSAVKAGREIAKLETKLAALKAKDKPQASRAAAPIESVKGGGAVSKDPSQMTDAEFAAWRRSQISRRR